MELEKYSFGVGDRFGREGRAQLMAIQEINRLGFPVVPVWNKSNREHELVGTTQEAVRREADEAVKSNNWKESYYVDADHITRSNVDKFLDYSDFFTIDVAGYIGKPPDQKLKEDFLLQLSICANSCHTFPTRVKVINTDFEVKIVSYDAWTAQSS